MSIGQYVAMEPRLQDVIQIVYMNTVIDINDDAEMQGLFSAMLTGLVCREFVKHLFLSRCVDGSDLLNIDGYTIQATKLVDLKALAKKMDIKGVSGMKKDTLVRLLLPYEDTLRYFPAEAIGRIRRYQEHLKRKKMVEKLIGKMAASSLTWLHDTDRPFYRYGDCSDEIGIFGVMMTLYIFMIQASSQ